MEVPSIPICPGEPIAVVAVAGPHEELTSEELARYGAGSSEKRRADLARGREAARRAVTLLIGPGNHDIGRGARGEPIFPQGTVGSISHKLDVAVAAAGRRDRIPVLGIDLESLAPRKADISKLIATPAELEWLAGAGERGVRTLFSAKESIYKALAPLALRYIGFKEAELTWNERRSLFTVVLQGEFHIESEIRSRLTVRVASTEESVLTMAVVDSEGR